MGGFDAALQKLEFEKIRQRVAHYSACEPGRELLKNLSVRFNLSEIRSELSRVTEMKRLLIETGGIPLEGIHQITSSVQRSSVEGTFLQPKDLLHIASTLKASRILRSSLSKQQAVFPVLWGIAELLYTDKVLEYNIEQAIDESGAVKASASRELQTIRRSINERYEQLKKRLESIIKGITAQGFSRDEIVTTREGRMVIPVKSEYKNHVPGFIHSASSSGATVFIEPAETLELNNEITSLHFQEQREIERILKALTGQVAACREHLLATVGILGQIDAIHAKAKYSIEILGTEPVLHQEGSLKIIQARHPILLLNHGYKSTVPLNLELGSGYHTLVISGPNAGGKSVAMKCVGLLVLMVQAGLHIPVAAESIFRPFKKLLVDIGDDQSIENDLSTFSSHLRNLKEIAELSDEATLVLIDEIGSGTDPSEGGAIAAALLEQLTRQKAFTIATTHHGALKAFAYETEGIENGAMEFDQSTLTPTYTFRAGVPGSSYALEMATRLGFAGQILDRSRGFLGQQQTRLASLITELEASAQKYNKDLQDVQAEKSKLDLLVGQYEAKVKAQAKELREIKSKALVEARQILQRANSVIERSVLEIKKTAAEKSVVKQARTEIESLRQEIGLDEKESAQTDLAVDDNPIIIGSSVTLKNGVETGEVVGLSADGKSAVVVFGNVKMKTSISDLSATGRRSEPARIHVPNIEDKARSIPRELDLRGMTGEEALPLVDKFIDDAMLVGLYRVDIIHGKGTGALRKRVTDFLTNHPRVKSFHLAEWNEGGTGATVVELQDN